MISDVERAVFLRGVGAFSEARTQELLYIAELCEEFSFAEGQTIFSQGDPGDSIFIVIEGAVELREGNQPVATSLPGGPFGGLAVFTGSPRHFTAVAVKPSRILRLGSQEVMDLIADNPSIALSVIKTLASSVVESSKALSKEMVFGREG